MLPDVTDLIHGPAAAAALVARMVERRGSDPGGARWCWRWPPISRTASAAAAGRGRGRDPLRRGGGPRRRRLAAPGAGQPGSWPRSPRARAWIPGLLERAGAAGTRGRRVPRLHDTADLNRGLWSRFVEDLETARAALRRSIARARDAGEDFALATFLSYLAATEELAGDYAAAADALGRRPTQVAAWHDWPPSPWHHEPRCELLIAPGEPGRGVRPGRPAPARRCGASRRAAFSGRCVRGRSAPGSGDPPPRWSHLERAAASADECDWADPGVRYRLDHLLAEAYVGVGRPG